MARYEDDSYYHIYNRGGRKAEIFFDAENYDYFLKLLKENAEKYLTAIIAYCLMPNHYHLLLLQQAGGRISKAIQTTMNSFVQGMNKRYALSGSLFQGKSRSKHIDSDEYALEVVRYIHLNPVRAHLVTSPDEWLYSNYRRWIEGDDSNQHSDSHQPSNCSDWFALRNSYFGSGEEYRKFVEDYRSNDESKFLFD